MRNYIAGSTGCVYIQNAARFLARLRPMETVLTQLSDQAFIAGWGNMIQYWWNASLLGSL